MYALKVRLKDFSAAHRLIKNYQGKCNHLHGHNYAVTIEVESLSLSDDDMMIDFSVLKKHANQWVQAHLDHATLVCKDDHALKDFLLSQQQKHYLMEKNTTAEAVAAVIFRALSPIIDHLTQGCCRLKKVTVAESDDCSAQYTAS